MGTRATYKIENVFYYIHWDGYEEGAAGYFLNMLNSYYGLIDGLGRSCNGGMAEAFLRGNNSASFTESHEVHSDTEYQYDVTYKDGQYFVEVRAYKFDSDTYHARGYHSLADFINRHLPNSAAIVKPNLYSKRQLLLTAEVLPQYLDNKLNLADTWIKNGHAESANYQNLMEEIHAYMAAYRSLVGSGTIDIEARYAAITT